MVILLNNVIYEALNISKEIEGKTVLNNISFRCEALQAIAICGKNGSGKSTLLKILAGIYTPTSGKVMMANKKIGYVPEHFPENLRFKLKEYLLLTASFNGKLNKSIEAKLEKYIEIFELLPYVNTSLKKCSKGTKQKVGLIQAMLSNPEILLLDEPLTGLDISTQNKFMEVLEVLKRTVSIIFTTHEDEMIDKFADQIIYVDTGKVITNINSRIRLKEIKVRFTNKEVFNELNATEIIYNRNHALIKVESSKSDELLLQLLTKKCSILEVKEVR